MKDEAEQETIEPFFLLTREDLNVRDFVIRENVAARTTEFVAICELQDGKLVRVALQEHVYREMKAQGLTRLYLQIDPHRRG